LNLPIIRVPKSSSKRKNRLIASVFQQPANPRLLLENFFRFGEWFFKAQKSVGRVSRAILGA
jgi:hypothetical protein